MSQPAERIDVLLGRGYVAARIGEIRKDDFVLDVGCAYGYFERLYLNHRARKVIGVDINANHITTAHQADGSSVYLVASAEALPFTDSSFTYVTCLDSLEHFVNDRKAISEMSRVLRQGGRILISVPNKFCDFLDPEFPRHRHYSVADLRSLLSDFEIERTYVAGFLLYQLVSWLRWVGIRIIIRTCGFLRVNDMPCRNLLRWILDRIAHLDFLFNYGFGFSLTLVARKRR